MGCKAILVLFNYFVMANFFWLLVEGLYLHTLLLIIHKSSAPLSVYMLIGWGRPHTGDLTRRRFPRFVSYPRLSEFPHVFPGWVPDLP